MIKAKMSIILWVGQEPCYKYVMYPCQMIGWRCKRTNSLLTMWSFRYHSLFQRPICSRVSAQCLLISVAVPFFSLLPLSPERWHRVVLVSSLSSRHSSPFTRSFVKVGQCDLPLHCILKCKSDGVPCPFFFFFFFFCLVCLGSASKI